MNSKAKRQSPSDIVRGLSRDELESVVLSQLASENNSLASAILARFGKAKNRHDWRTLILQCRDNHSDNDYGIVDDPDGLAADIDELKKKVSQPQEIDSINNAFNLYAAIVEAIAPDAYEADDHDGVLLEIVNESLEDLLSLATRTNTAPSCLSEIRTWARANVDAKWAHEGDSWDYDLYAIELATARDSRDFNASIKRCELKCTVVNQDNSHEQFLAERLAELVCSALETAGDSTRLQAFINTHLDLDPVRTIAICRARDSHDLDKAESLIRDGMSLAARRKHPGMIDHYAMELVSILDERGQPDAAIEFALSKTLSTYSMNWYAEVMKRISNSANRKAMTDRILSHSSRHDEYFAATICALERRWEELQVLAVKNSSIMRQHYQALGKHYPESVARWLDTSIRQALRTAQDRSSYQKTAALVRDLLRIAGKPAAESLVRDLVATYSNRPAMIEELRKAIT
ncbi:MAG: hypothetical protein A2Y38_08680 [Spirochaetes bacterium GWB1_59_5]|nr:MAG: hypothetical protein A2Y38_08680 [Spirochaetes bacterium GWB1_59_5]